MSPFYEIFNIIKHLFKSTRRREVLCGAWETGSGLLVSCGHMLVSRCWWRRFLAAPLSSLSWLKLELCSFFLTYFFEMYLLFLPPKQRISGLRDVERGLFPSSFDPLTPFVKKKHLMVLFSVNICPFDVHHKLSPMGVEKLKKIAVFALSPRGFARHSLTCFGFFFFLFLFPILAAVWVTSGLLWRQLIDSLTNKMDFVMLQRTYSTGELEQYWVWATKIYLYLLDVINYIWCFWWRLSDPGIFGFSRPRGTVVVEGCKST